MAYEVVQVNHTVVCSALLWMVGFGFGTLYKRVDVCKCGHTSFCTKAEEAIRYRKLH